MVAKKKTTPAFVDENHNGLDNPSTTNQDESPVDDGAEEMVSADDPPVQDPDFYNP